MEKSDIEILLIRLIRLIAAVGGLLARFAELGWKEILQAFI
jgi:hypothetical protein